MLINQNLFGLDNSLQVPSIPYMGNKRKLATRIINTIIDLKGQNFKNFYDLFGGGGSMSVCALNLRNVDVHYNELNKAIFNLMNHIKDGGEIPYKWVTREEFFECIKGNTWWDGLVQSCWSFGNNPSKGYLYGKDIEDIKYLAHQVCVDKDKKALKQLVELTGFDIKLNFKKDPQHIRLQLKNIIEQNKSDRLDIQHLERLQLIQHLTHLTRLNSLHSLHSLHSSNLSYKDVEIKSNSIIYCDPPYKGTAEYKNNGFNHNEFYEWALNNNNPVFISEYFMPSDFQLIASFKHKSTLSATNNDKEVIENLYWNGK